MQQQQKQQLGALWPRCHSDWDQVTRLLDAALNFDEFCKFICKYNQRVLKPLWDHLIIAY